MPGDAIRRHDFADEFDSGTLDESVWLPHYLPVWSSKDATRPTYSLRDSCLSLSIPPDQGLWCAEDHRPPLRVSGIQSGNYSGPAGSHRGQQRFRDGQTVLETQERFEGWLPTGGHVEIRCRMDISPRSMAALFLSGFEDDSEQLQCGELCVVEIFGNAVDGSQSAEVGMGIKAFRDPALTQDFAAPRLPLDVAEFHTYAVDWDEEAAVFSVDGEDVRRCPRAPAYPLQAMVAVYDFPDWSTGDDDHLIPELVVDWIRGS